jgi:UDP-N-acetylmuramoyl-L-alanyl-D-glutamate--2,6-diaminopimelate ligase
MKIILNNKIKTTLADLVRETAGMTELAVGNGSTEINSIEYDSRNVQKGSLFIAIEGFKNDGHSYINAALKKGASAVLIAKNRNQIYARLRANGTAMLTADDPRGALSRISAAFYGFPSRSMMMIGITGTNGKTSITSMP